MMAFILLLIVAWIVLAVLGLAIKGLLWLFFVGVVLFLITSAIGWFSSHR